MRPEYQYDSVLVSMMQSDAAVTSEAFGHGYKFTGKERYTETGLDYFRARYYGSNMGRFLSSDSLGIPRDRLSDPQQLNLYSYVRNNPH